MAIKHDPFAISLASHLDPCLEFFIQLGTPYEKALYNSGLPSSWSDAQYVPSLAIIHLVTELALKEGVTEIGLELSRAPSKLPLHPAFQASLDMADSLLDALQVAARYCTLQGSHMRMWLLHKGDDVWLCHQGANPSNLIGSDQFEWNRIERLLGLIRRFLGDSWNPEKLWLYTLTAVGEKFKDLTGDCEIKRHPHYGIIPISLKDLGLDKDSLPRFAAPSPIATNWVYNLRQVLPGYVGERTLNPDCIAQLTGMSKRSLQRQLSNQQLSVSSLVEEAKITRATQLLTLTDLSLSEVALRCGYTDKSNFSRFFRRMTGHAPGAIRDQRD